MMRKKIVSLCMALVLCLGLLPATALAAAPSGQELYVGNVKITSTGYWTTSADGKTITSVGNSQPSSGGYIHYDADTNTLTLHNATIKKALDYGDNPPNSLIHGAAIGVFNQSDSAELTINLVGTNTIADVSCGIYVLAHSNGGATLTITGNGSLTTEGSGSGSLSGILVQSNAGNANLTINNVDVTATNSNTQGIRLQSAGSSTVSLTVNGGELTASGTDAGIDYVFGNDLTGSSTPTVTVSGNAIVRANGGISNNSSTEIQIGADSNESNGGIVFDGNKGTVYGSVTLQEDLTIGEGESLDIPSGASLTIDSGATLTNEGTVTTTDGGTLTNEGTINNSGTLPSNIGGNTPPSITTTSLTDGTVGAAYNATLEASGDPTSWEITEGTLPAGLTLAESTGVISGTPTTAGTSTFTVKAESSYGSDSKELSITINEPATISVTGVSLNQSALTLTEEETATLTATVQPANATNQNVTWTSSNTSVATVQNGTVTAVSAGTATITVTTADGGFTATCAVTVRPDIPPANPNYRITVEATQGGTVTADPTAAKAGATVTLTPVPDRGYQVGSVAVTDRFGDAVAVTEQADGTYTFTMPNGQVTVTVTFAEAPLPFPDVTEGDWFYDAVRYAYETGLMDGVGDNLFAPNSETTRAQLVTILYRLAGQPAVSGDLPFPDVESGTWYTDAVAWAAENGIVNGVSDTEFAPGDDITREQLAAILYRYAAYQGYDVSQRADLSGFGDASSISPYAQEALSWAHAQGLVLGFEDGSLRPQGTASRAQIAAVLMRFLAAVPAE